MIRNPSGNVRMAASPSKAAQLQIPLQRVARVIALQATETRYLDRLAVKMDGLTRFVPVKDMNACQRHEMDRSGRVYVPLHTSAKEFSTERR